MNKLIKAFSVVTIISILLFGTLCESNYRAFAVDQISQNGKIDDDYVWEIKEDSIIITNCHNNITITMKDDICYVDTNNASNIVEDFLVNHEEIEKWSESELKLFEQAFENTIADTVVIKLYYSDNIITVNDKIFVGDRILSVNLGNEVKYIGNLTFECSSIENVEFPHSLEKIGERAFNECNELTTVNLGENVNEIGKMAFFDCNNLKSAVIHSKNADIQEFAFGYCRNGNEKTKINDFVISGYSGSTAETYAIDNGFTFIALDDNPITTTTTTITTTATTSETETDSTTTSTTTTVDDTTTTTITTTDTITSTTNETETTVEKATTSSTESTNATTKTTVTTDEAETGSTTTVTKTTTDIVTTEKTTLPQTGYSEWYQTLAVLAACMTGIGGAMVIGSGILKKEDRL